jgi:hypothetical protein
VNCLFWSKTYREFIRGWIVDNIFFLAIHYL